MREIRWVTILVNLLLLELPCCRGLDFLGKKGEAPRNLILDVVLNI